LSDLRIDINIGDSIDVFRTWATSKGYKIEEYIR